MPSLLRNAQQKPARKRGSAGAAAVADGDGSAVDAARNRARRRLIGAVVLLAIGVVGFPLVFETEPRPVALDTPIEMPARSQPGSQPASPPGSEPKSEPAPRPTPAAPTAMPRDEPAPAPPAERTAIDEPPPKAVAEAPSPAIVRPAAPAQPDDGARAAALLDGSDAASAAKQNRYVVQAGAYTDANALRDARAKVEKLGLKTYTQVVDADGTKRTRVRTGPYPSRDEADAAAARIRAAGLQVSVLAL